MDGYEDGPEYELVQRLAADGGVPVRDLVVDPTGATTPAADVPRLLA